MIGGRKRLNKAHPDCAEYTRKFYAIWDAYEKREEEEKAKYPDYHGQDHPAYVVLRPIHRKCCEATKALQEEYAYLFTEEGPEEE